MPTPLVHIAVPTVLFLTTEGKRLSLSKRQWFKLVFVLMLLANVPDIDLVPAMLNLSRYQEIHRAWGHNIFSAGLLALLGAFILRSHISPIFKGARGYFTSFFLVMSHLLLDACGHENGFQPHVPLFWPLSNWKFTLPLKFCRTMEPFIPPPDYHLKIFSLPYFEALVDSEGIPTLTVLALWFGLLGATEVISSIRIRDKILNLLKN